MKTVDKDTWAVFKGFLEGKDKEIIESAEDRKLPIKTFNLIVTGKQIGRAHV